MILPLVLGLWQDRPVSKSGLPCDKNTEDGAANDTVVCMCSASGQTGVRR